MPTKRAKTDNERDMASWSAIEDEMKTHDQAMVKDYAEDVDNLLVFAGLFSAVLTAFLVESYPLLQEDNSEINKKLLVRISTQLESFSLSSNFANSTNLPQLPSDRFRPSRPALWINALWFLSLIFSLSAAFFGIRARQWLREYMQWSAALAHPRENVYVRQIRFEALAAWQVFGSISVIPGLLELALVLFAAGIVIFLWTLDITIAIFVTIAVSAFLATASTITILPAFFKRCPYKSPTAWAFVSLLNHITAIITFLGAVRTSYELMRTDSRYQDFQTSWRKTWGSTVFGRARPRTWRDWDAQGGCLWEVKREGSAPDDIATYIDDEIFEAVCADVPNARYRNRPKTSWWSRFNVNTVTSIRVNEPLWLIRALNWVIQSSQGMRVHQHAIQCAGSIHQSGYPRSFWGIIQTSHLSDLYLLFHFCFRSSSTPQSIVASALDVRRKLHKRLEWHYPGNDLKAVPCPPIRGAVDEDIFQYTDRDELKIFSSVLVHDLRRLACSVTWGPDSWLFPPDNTAILDFISAFYVIKEVHRDSITNESLPVLVEAFNGCQSGKRRTTARHSTGGIKAILFEFIFSFGTSFTHSHMFNETGHLVARPESSQLDATTLLYTFVMSFAEYRGDDLDDIDDLRIFAVSAGLWIESLCFFTPHPGQSTAMVHKMTEQAKFALEYGYRNCGNGAPPPWFGFALACKRWRETHRAPEWLYNICCGDPAPFAELVQVLHDSNERGLLSGTVQKIIPDLSLLAAIPADACHNVDSVREWLTSQESSRSTEINDDARSGYCFLCLCAVDDTEEDELPADGQIPAFEVENSPGDPSLEVLT